MGKLCAVPRARQGRAGEAGGYREQGAGLALQVPCSQTHCLPLTASLLPSAQAAYPETQPRWKPAGPN